MSEYTTQSTEFEQGSCCTCGSDSYGMLSDGPRCYGCKRFVLKDTGIDWGHGMIRHLAFQSPLTLEALDEIIAAQSPMTWQEAEERAHAIAASFSERFFAADGVGFDPRPRRRTWRKTKRWQGRRAPLKATDALTEAEAILKEART